MMRWLGLGLLILVLMTGSATAAEADVVVVGGGAAGMAAAIEAAETGAEVILLEKLPMLGGALRYTAGTISGAGTKIQEAQGIEDSPELHFLDSMVEADFLAIPDLLMLYCELAGPTIDWLVEDLDVNIVEAVFAPEHTLYSVPRSYKPERVDGMGAVLYGLLEGIERYPNITVHMETKAIRLLQDPLTDRIMGVGAVDGQGRYVEFHGVQGTILATGGFGSNQRLLERYQPESSNWVMITASGATGDGHRMGAEVGAGLTHMEFVPTYNYGFIRANGQPALVYVRSELFGGIYVNQDGERFVNEMTTQKEREYALRQQPDNIMFEVFDESIRLANNRPHINAFCESGEIASAATIRGLAAEVGLDPDVFEATINRYNAFVEHGEDLDYGKEQLMAKIAEPPFYAAKLRPLGLLTLGGLTVDTTMRVLNQDGDIIPGLYAAGELLGGVHGTHISSGNGITAPLAFGRLAGQQVVLAEPFSLGQTEAVQEDVELVDGVFRAEVESYGGRLTVEVEIVNAEIVRIDVLSHQDTSAIADPAFATLIDRMLEANSPHVDAVSGATVSSDALVEAVLQAVTE